MSDPVRDSLEQKIARLRSQVEAAQRELSDYDRARELLSKLNLTVVPDTSRPGPLRDVASLAHMYRTDLRSPYHGVQFSTRNSYDRNTARLVKDFDGALLA